METNLSLPVRRITGPRGRLQTGAPHTVDIRLTGLCQLRCAWCWGPEHHRAGTVDPRRWSTILSKLAASGTRHIVFSGGEPTLYRGLETCIAVAKQRGLRITLSTNGIDIGRLVAVLGDVHDIGIPFDGSTPEMSEVMRSRSNRHDAWLNAIRVVRMVQNWRRRTSYQSGPVITIRTVIGRPNLADVADIPEMLSRNGVDLSDLRIKLYQVEPFGPHVSGIDFKKDWAITAEEARLVARRLREKFPNVNIVLQLYEDTAGRYFLVDPDGNATGTDEDVHGGPVEVHYGNLVNDFDRTIDEYVYHQIAVRSRLA